MTKLSTFLKHMMNASIGVSLALSIGAMKLCTTKETSPAPTITMLHDGLIIGAL